MSRHARILSKQLGDQKHARREGFRARLLGASGLLALAGAFAGQSTPAIAGCSNNNPQSGETVTCDANPPNPDTVGIQSPGATDLAIDVLSGAIVDTEGGQERALDADEGSFASINNDGVIRADRHAVFADSVGSITNTGTLESGSFDGATIDARSGLGSLVNSGEITAAVNSGVFTEGDIASVENSGLIEGQSNAIFSGGTINEIVNTGTLTGLDFDANASNNIGTIENA